MPRAIKRKGRVEAEVLFYRGQGRHPLVPCCAGAGDFNAGVFEHGDVDERSRNSRAGQAVYALGIALGPHPGQHRAEFGLEKRYVDIW